MKPTQIKISDLLLESGKKDDIYIHSLHIDSIPRLCPEGISANIHLQSLDTSTIAVTLNDLHCMIHELSDLSGEAYIRTVQVHDYNAKFVTAISKLQDEGDDPVFPIHGDFIDIKDMVYQAIQLQEPIIKHTPEEQRKLIQQDDEDDDIDTGAKIGFTYVKKK